MLRMHTQIQQWLRRDPDPITRQELEQLLQTQDHKALSERFAGRIRFGTAGLRALMGAGPTRMNRLVVQESTMGLGHYVREHVPNAPKRGVIIGYDARLNSLQFARDAACVLLHLGFDVSIFNRAVPTPLVGFAMQRKHFALGIVITASHNPPAYNGYKVYWENAAQIVPPHDAGIAAAIDVASQMPLVNCDWAHCVAQSQVTLLDDTLEQDYLAQIAAYQKPHASSPSTTFQIAYTPLHGVGARMTQMALSQAQFSPVHVVESQKQPDGHFPTVRFPNPEEPGAMDAVLALAQTQQADLVCANDPDADRLAVAAPTDKGRYQRLSGDELGAILALDCLRHAPKHAVVATTLVSSRLLQHMARAHNVAYFETLTGFKWIANGAQRRRALGQTCIFAYEEALGYMLGDLVWDKDGIHALLAIAHIARKAKGEHNSLWAHLEAIHRQFGLFLSTQRTLAIDIAQSKNISTALRTQPPQHIAGCAVKDILDLQTPAAGAPSTMQFEPPILPSSNVLIYTLADDARVIVRPSGTEPKLKCYYEMHTKLQPDSDYLQARRALAQRLETLADAHTHTLQSMLPS